VGDKSVFRLVLYSWAVLAAAFGPLLAVYCLRQRPNEKLAVSMLVSGVATIFVWKHFSLSQYIYEIAPGILVGFIIFLLGKQAGWTLPEQKTETAAIQKSN